MFRKKWFLPLFLVFLMVFLITGCQSKNSIDNSNTNISPDNGVVENKAEAIKNLFVEKYGQPAEDISLTFSQETVDHARGGVSFSPGAPGGNFLAAKVGGQWKLVFDGNGGIACSELEKYNFPADMMTDCYKPAPIVYDFLKEDWKTYYNEILRYSISYPNSVSLITDDEERSVEFLGPSSNGQRWPKITITHLGDGYYRPSLGTDVKEWIKMSPGFELGSEIQLAGLSTVHFWQPQTAQVQAADYYYFIKDQQLYKIVVYHSDNKQDREVYSRFLESFSFTK
jgi:hypothetical protein